jgi:hypothetical protein
LTATIDFNADAFGRIALHVCFLLLEGVVLVSDIWYSSINDADPRNKFPTLFCILFVFSLCFVLHAGHGLWNYWVAFLMSRRKLSMEIARLAILDKIFGGCQCVRPEGVKIIHTAAGDDDDESQFQFLDGRMRFRSANTQGLQDREHIKNK